MPNKIQNLGLVLAALSCKMQLQQELSAAVVFYFGWGSVLSQLMINYGIIPHLNVPIIYFI